MSEAIGVYPQGSGQAPVGTFRLRCTCNLAVMQCALAHAPGVANSCTDMRTLAASFRDIAAARAAQAGLVRMLVVDSGTLRIGSLGRTSPHADPATILAGNFREEAVKVARDIIRSFGGILVVDVDEKRTHP
jgi:hypothetical protein